MGAVGNERAAVRDAILERDQARIEAAELRGQLAAERVRVRRLEELLLTLASDRADPSDTSASSTVARELLERRDETTPALSEPADAPSAADRLFERTIGAEPRPETVGQMREAFAAQLEHVRADVSEPVGQTVRRTVGQAVGQTAGQTVNPLSPSDEPAPEPSHRWAAWRDGLDVPGAVCERLMPGAERRAAGQFMTPFVLADLMAGWLLREPKRRLLDPAVGSGRLLFRAHSRPEQAPVQVIGWDVDELAIAMAELDLRLRGVRRFELHRGDFLLDVEDEAAAELPERLDHHSHTRSWSLRWAG